MSDHVCAWPGGMGRFKLRLNYMPGFIMRPTATKLRYQRLLWLLGETVAEAGAMNIFVVLECPDGGDSHQSSHHSHALMKCTAAELTTMTTTPFSPPGPSDHNSLLGM